jgi:hypothetical protein
VCSGKFGTEDGNVSGGLDSKTHPVAANLQDRNGDAAIQHQLLTRLPAEYEHVPSMK